MSKFPGKPFVLALAPNPSLDLGGFVEKIRPNEKTYVHQSTLAPGGNSLNAGRILHRLKVPVLVTGFAGGGIGDQILELLDQEKLQHAFVRSRASSRINVTVSNAFNHLQTRLSFPGPRILPAEKKKLLSLVRRSENQGYLIVGGSLPQSFTTRDVQKIIQQAHATGMRVIVDCPGGILRDLIGLNPYLIKPNLLEFQDLMRTRQVKKEAIAKSAKNLLNRIPFVCISSVEGGALMVSRQGIFFGKLPTIKIRSTVGAGDSMVGAMVAQLYSEVRNPADLLRWGLAAAGATLTRSGTELGTAADIRALVAKVRIKQLQL